MSSQALPGRPTQPASRSQLCLDVISGYVESQWCPAPSLQEGVKRGDITVMTSQEIVLALADVVDLDNNDVANAMITLGYRTGVIDGKAGWMLLRASPGD